MPRIRRSDLPDGIYHVTARGVAGEAVYLDDLDRRLFLRLLADTIQRHTWTCLALCLMTTHYHLVIDTTRLRLSAGVQRLNGIYAQRFNRRHTRHGHLFGDRFSSWLIDDEDYLRETCSYVLLNPVRAGLCERAEDWPWSGAAFPQALDERTFDG